MRFTPLAAERGLTLIEVLIAVVVLSVMSLMAYGGLNVVVDHSQKIEQIADRSAAYQRAYFRLRNDFQNLRDRPMRDAFGDSQPSVFLDIDGGLNFVRGGWRNPLGSDRSSLERVRYVLEEDAIRRESWSSIDLIQETEPSTLTLLDQIEDMQFRLLDAAGQWREDWPPGALPGAAGAAAEEPPPIAVELLITTADWEEIRLLFRTPQAGLAPRGQSSAGGGLASGPAPKLLTKSGLLPAATAGALSGSGNDSGAAPLGDEGTATLESGSSPDDGLVTESEP